MLVRTSLAVLASAALLPVPAAAQQRDDSTSVARNAIYLEGHLDDTPFVLKNYDLFTLHYERFLTPSIGIGIGFSRATPIICPMLINNTYCKPTIYRVPLTASWLSGDKHRFELGSGVLLGHSSPPVNGSRNGFLWSVLTRIGYRYQPREGGLSFRAAYKPQFFGNQSGWLGFAVGIGYAF